MKFALGQLNDWMKVNRLKLNQDKTQFMWIGRNQMLDKIDWDDLHSYFPDMNMNNLGVVLDEHLDMGEQIGSICRSGFYHLHQIRGIRCFLSFCFTYPRSGQLQCKRGHSPMQDQLTGMRCLKYSDPSDEQHLGYVKKHLTTFLFAPSRQFIDLLM